jgi:hypothetical protein
MSAHSLTAHVDHICIVYKHLLQHNSASSIPTFYEYLDLSYTELTDLSDEGFRREVWMALGNRPIPPDPPRDDEHDEVYVGGEDSSASDGHADPGRPPLPSGNRVQSRLSGHDIVTLVAEVLIKEDTRKVYGKFVDSVRLLGRDVFDRKRVLKKWCYEEWNEEL